MAELAIKGHKTRGKEVIALLEMLGGKNNPVIPYNGSDDDCYYFISEEKSIGISRHADEKPYAIYKGLTLEEFEELFPYKIGDKVDCRMFGIRRVSGMAWLDQMDLVLYLVQNEKDMSDVIFAYTQDLRPYNPEPAEPSPDKAKAPVLQGQDYSEGRCVYKIPEGFEFDKVEDGEIILKPKKKELPKTYGECCEVLGINDLPYMAYTWNRNEDVEVVLLEPQVTLLQQLEVLRKLIVCRDAYWKLAGDWKPNYNGYNGNCDEKYCFRQYGSTFISTMETNYGCVLMFPTEEMRETFYENFKDWIGECKELL